MAKIDEDVATNAICFLARKVGFETAIAYYQCNTSKNYVVRLMKKYSFGMDIIAVLYASSTDTLEYVVLKDDNDTSYASILKTLLDYCIDHTIVLNDVGYKIFMKKGTTLEQILVEMDMSCA